MTITRPLSSRSRKSSGADLQASPSTSFLDRSTRSKGKRAAPPVTSESTTPQHSGPDASRTPATQGPAASAAEDSPKDPDAQDSQPVSSLAPQPKFGNPFPGQQQVGSDAATPSQSVHRRSTRAATISATQTGSAAKKPTLRKPPKRRTQESDSGDDSDNNESNTETPALRTRRRPITASRRQSLRNKEVTTYNDDSSDGTPPPPKSTPGNASGYLFKKRGPTSAYKSRDNPDAPRVLDEFEITEKTPEPEVPRKKSGRGYIPLGFKKCERMDDGPDNEPENEIKTEPPQQSDDSSIIVKLKVQPKMLAMIRDGVRFDEVSKSGRPLRRKSVREPITPVKQDDQRRPSRAKPSAKNAPKRSHKKKQPPKKVEPQTSATDSELPDLHTDLDVSMRDSSELPWRENAADRSLLSDSNGDLLPSSRQVRPDRTREPGASLRVGLQRLGDDDSELENLLRDSIMRGRSRDPRDAEADMLLAEADANLKILSGSHGHLTNGSSTQTITPEISIPTSPEEEAAPIPAAETLTVEVRDDSTEKGTSKPAKAPSPPIIVVGCELPPGPPALSPPTPPRWAPLDAPQGQSSSAPRTSSPSGNAWSWAEENDEPKNSSQPAEEPDRGRTRTRHRSVQGCQLPPGISSPERISPKITPLELPFGESSPVRQPDKVEEPMSPYVDILLNAFQQGLVEDEAEGASGKALTDMWTQMDVTEVRQEEEPKRLSQEVEEPAAEEEEDVAVKHPRRTTLEGQIQEVIKEAQKATEKTLPEQNGVPAVTMPTLRRSSRRETMSRKKAQSPSLIVTLKANYSRVEFKRDKVAILEKAPEVPEAAEEVAARGTPEIVEESMEDTTEAPEAAKLAAPGIAHTQEPVLTKDTTHISIAKENMAIPEPRTTVRKLADTQQPAQHADEEPVEETHTPTQSLETSAKRKSVLAQKSALLRKADEQMQDAPTAEALAQPGTDNAIVEETPENAASMPNGIMVASRSASTARVSPAVESPFNLPLTQDLTPENAEAVVDGVLRDALKLRELSSEARAPKGVDETRKAADSAKPVDEEPTKDNVATPQAEQANGTASALENSHLVPDSVIADEGSDSSMLVRADSSDVEVQKSQPTEEELQSMGNDVATDEHQMRNAVGGLALAGMLSEEPRGNSTPDFNKMLRLQGASFQRGDAAEDTITDSEGVLEDLSQDLQSRYGLPSPATSAAPSPEPFTQADAMAEFGKEVEPESEGEEEVDERELTEEGQVAAILNGMSSLEPALRKSKFSLANSLPSLEISNDDLYKTGPLPTCLGCRALDILRAQEPSNGWADPKEATAKAVSVISNSNLQIEGSMFPPKELFCKPCEALGAALWLRPAIRLAAPKELASFIATNSASPAEVLNDHLPTNPLRRPAEDDFVDSPTKRIVAECPLCKEAYSIGSRGHLEECMRQEVEAIEKPREGQLPLLYKPEVMEKTITAIGKCALKDKSDNMLQDILAPEMVDVKILIDSLSSTKSQPEKLAAQNNSIMALHLMQEEYFQLELMKQKMMLASKRIPTKMGTTPWAGEDPVAWDDQRQADVYEFEYDPAPAKRGNQTATDQGPKNRAGRTTRNIRVDLEQALSIVPGYSDSDVDAAKLRADMERAQRVKTAKSALQVPPAVQGDGSLRSPAMSTFVVGSVTPPATAKNTPPVKRKPGRPRKDVATTTTVTSAPTTTNSTPAAKSWTPIPPPDLSRIDNLSFTPKPKVHRPRVSIGIADDHMGLPHSPTSVRPPSSSQGSVHEASLAASQDSQVMAHHVSDLLSREGLFVPSTRPYQPPSFPAPKSPPTPADPLSPTTSTSPSALPALAVSDGTVSEEKSPPPPPPPPDTNGKRSPKHSLPNISIPGPMSEEEIAEHAKSTASLGSIISYVSEGGTRTRRSRKTFEYGVPKKTAEDEFKELMNAGAAAEMSRRKRPASKASSILNLPPPKKRQKKRGGSMGSSVTESVPESVPESMETIKGKTIEEKKEEMHEAQMDLAEKKDEGVTTDDQNEETRMNTTMDDTKQNRPTTTE